MSRVLVLVVLWLLSALVVARPPPATPKLLYVFEDGTALENVATRPNGSLVMTTPTRPVVYTLDPTTAAPTPRILAHIDSPSVNCTIGLTEFAPDQFAIVGALCDLAALHVMNASVWTLDARTGRVRHAANVPGAGIANDLAPLPGHTGVLLLSDSANGAVWRVDTHTGAVKRVIQDAALAPPAGGLGINGLRVVGNELLFVNTGQGFVGSVPIHADGTQAGHVKVLYQPSDASMMDDFDIDLSTGHVYVADFPSSVLELTMDGKLVAQTSGLQVTMGGTTSCVLGRGRRFEQELYVVADDGAIWSYYNIALALLK